VCGELHCQVTEEDGGRARQSQENRRFADNGVEEAVAAMSDGCLDDRSTAGVTHRLHALIVAARAGTESRRRGDQAEPTKTAQVIPSPIKIWLADPLLAACGRAQKPRGRSHSQVNRFLEAAIGTYSSTK